MMRKVKLKTWSFEIPNELYSKLKSQYPKALTYILKM
jgi:hypothetical protein